MRKIGKQLNGEQWWIQDFPDGVPIPDFGVKTYYLARIRQWLIWWTLNSSIKIWKYQMFTPTINARKITGTSNMAHDTGKWPNYDKNVNNYRLKKKAISRPLLCCRVSYLGLIKTKWLLEFWEKTIQSCAWSFPHEKVFSIFPTWLLALLDNVFHKLENNYL